MSATTPGFVGARLVQARKARGLTAVNLADLLGISSASISHYEHGRQAPRPEVLNALAQQLNLPHAFFFRPLPPSPERKMFWRSQSAATKAARERAESRYDWLRELVVYFEGYFDFPKLNLPAIRAPKDFRNLASEQIEDLAQECRLFWGEGASPIKNLVLTLENNGVIVSRGRLGAETLDAFSEWLERDYPYVFLGTDKASAVRSRFDAAHEYAHLILHRNVNRKEIGSAKEFRLIENQAHRFANAFLLPKESFLKELWAPTLDAFASLKKRWKVSIKAMIVRAHQLELLDDTQYRRMIISYSRRWSAGEPFDDELEPESPRLLARCLDMLVSERIKTKQDILADLTFAASDIEELVGLPSGYLSDRTGEVVDLPKVQIKGDIENQKKAGMVIPFTSGKR